MPKNTVRVGIILPTYNEAANISPLISKILDQEKFLSNLNFQIIVADSASVDDTGAIVKKLASRNPKIHFLDVKLRGIGLAIVRAAEYAIEKLRVKYLVVMDADFSHRPSDIPKILKALRGDFDLVIGSRFVKGGASQVDVARQIFSWGASVTMRLLTGFWKVKEWTTAFRGIKTSFWRKIDFDRIPWRKRSFVFQPIFLYHALAAGAKWCEVPIVFNRRKAGRTKISTLGYIFDTLRFGFEIFLRRRATFVKFLIVGTASFIVNSSVLFLLYDGGILPFLPAKNTFWQFLLFVHPDVRLFIASVIAVETAIVFSFLWHENWTFRYRPKRGLRIFRFLRFNVTASGSPLITIATVNTLTPFFGIYYLISNAIGVLLGLSWNWLWNTKVIWRG